MGEYIDTRHGRLQRMELRLQIKTNSDGGPCWDNSCPARYQVIGGKGGYVIQGKRLDAATLAQLGELPDDELAVWVPGPVIDGKG